MSFSPLLSPTRQRGFRWVPRWRVGLRSGEKNAVRTRRGGRKSHREQGGDSVMQRPTVRGVKFTAAALLLCGISALAATGLAYVLRTTPPPPAPAEPQIPAGYFRDWPKPDLALVLSGEQHGYLLPCCC